MLKPSPDVLFLIQARIDSGASRGAPQLRKDVQVLKKAAAEIERLRGLVSQLQPASSVLIECGLEGLTLRNGDGLRLDLLTSAVHVFRDDDAPALLRGQIPARVTWRPYGCAAAHYQGPRELQVIPTDSHAPPVAVAGERPDGVGVALHQTFSQDTPMTPAEPGHG